MQFDFIALRTFEAQYEKNKLKSVFYILLLGMAEFVQFLRTLSKMYSVEHREASHPAPVFTSLQLDIYRSRITNELLGSLFNRIQGRQLVLAEPFHRWPQYSIHDRTYA